MDGFKGIYSSAKRRMNTYNFYGVKCEVWDTQSQAALPYPWRFAIWKDGKRIMYQGIPNYCETKRSAIMRARWRAKWIAEGTYHLRYVKVQFWP